MFRGIDEVDWASLRHGYGSAEDVPGLLRGLASADPAERESALDGMYGAVHHQGGVYDATLACVPFLLALAVREEVRDRAGVVELLVSIGDIAGDRCVSEDIAGRAVAALHAGADVFVRLAGDADAGVRRAAPGALVRFLGPPGRVLALLRERITVERDDRVLLALAASLGLFVERHQGHASEAVDLLAELSGPPYGPGLRLAAFGQLARCAPELLPANLVPAVVRLLRDRSGEHTRTGHSGDCPGTDTLIVAAAPAPLGRGGLPADADAALRARRPGHRPGRPAVRAVDQPGSPRPVQRRVDVGRAVPRVAYERRGAGRPHRCPTGSRGRPVA